MKPVYYALALLATITAAVPAGSAEAFRGPLDRPLTTVTPSLGFSESTEIDDGAASATADLEADDLVANVGNPAVPAVGSTSVETASQARVAEDPWIPRPLAERTGGAVAGAGILVLLWHLVRLWLGTASFAALFSRTEKGELLEHPVRESIHDAISQRPGISLSGLQGLLGIGWGTAVYHVERLEAARLIVSVRFRQFRRFYRNGCGVLPDDRKADAELSNETARQLAFAVSERPGTIQRDLCLRVGVRPSVANKHLGRLEQAQLLTRHQAHGTVQYYPTERLDALVSTAGGGPASAPLPASPA